MTCFRAIRFYKCIVATKCVDMKKKLNIENFNRDV